MDGPPGKTKPSGREVHRVRLVQLAPRAVRVQDDVAGLDVPLSVHFNVLVEAAEGCVPWEEGQVWAWQLHACSPGALDGLGQQVDAVIDGPKQRVNLEERKHMMY